MQLGVDVGGTFTDAVLLDGASVHSAKSPTTPSDQSEGVLAAIEAVLAAARAEPGQVDHLAHGMTVGTNALLERRGARTLLLATDGFTDLLEIARQDRPSLYCLCADRPPPLSPPELRVGVRERISHEGVVEALSDEEIERVIGEVRGCNPEAVAICLLFAHLDATHERRLAAALREELPGLHVSVSSEVLPRFREYERCATTVLDAYLAPLLGSYLDHLRGRCAERGLPEPAVMQSSGGIATLADVGGGGAWSVLSGPAGGAVGAGLVASLSGDGDALGFDMGGTSCDVCVIAGGAVGRSSGREFAQRPIQLPMLDVHTVGAGGGSVAWIDPGGALRVGPRSAGAEPGPACYGRSGTEPTVTDANLLLGYLDPAGELAGGVALDADAARRAIGPLAAGLGLGIDEAAAGIVAVANAEMVRAMRVITVERGVDPRRFDLLPFGGAGPLHAAAVAAELEIDRILCPRSGGVLSALGLVASDRRRETARSVMLAGDALTAERIATEIETLLEAVGGAADGVTVETVYELRYAGQSFELPIAGPTHPEPAALARDFAAEHERRYGYSEPEAEIELITIRLAVTTPVAPVRELRASGGEPVRSRRPMRFAGRWAEGEVLRGELPAGLEVAGPCALELPETTLLMPPGWRAQVDDSGTIVARRESR
ncbi:MAG: hydantoinase/oxoprolinase family protein [Solirubrobacterales bacterium]